LLLHAQHSTARHSMPAIDGYGMLPPLAATGGKERARPNPAPLPWHGSPPSAQASQALPEGGCGRSKPPRGPTQALLGTHEAAHAPLRQGTLDLHDLQKPTFLWLALAQGKADARPKTTPRAMPNPTEHAHGRRDCDKLSVKIGGLVAAGACCQCTRSDSPQEMTSTLGLRPTKKERAAVFLNTARQRGPSPAEGLDDEGPI
jgi:hypothetical protein